MRVGGAVTLGDFATAKMAPLQRTPSIDVAIEQGLVYVDLQPVVDLATGKARGYESLARCRIPELASPLQLFAAAQEQKAIWKLGRELRRLSTAAAHGAMLFLNVHPWELDDQMMVDAEDPIATHTGRLVIEIPEGSPLLRYRFAHANLDTLRSRGVALALDDFGAGYSNFGYIAQLAPEIVKLDRELIAGAKIGSRQHTLITSLNALCRAQGARVVAEGIETADELAAVIDAGIPYGQGFYLGRPSATGAVTWTP